jgi:hypothetical protein
MFVVVQSLDDAGEEPTRRTMSHVIAGVTITTSAEPVRAVRPAPADLKGDPIRAEAKVPLPSFPAHRG